MKVLREKSNQCELEFWFKKVPDVKLCVALRKHRIGIRANPFVLVGEGNVPYHIKNPGSKIFLIIFPFLLAVKKMPQNVFHFFLCTVP